MASEAASTASDKRSRSLGSRAFTLPRPADHRHLYAGFTNALATAIELVLTPVLFLFAGLWLDGRFGTRPVFGVIFAFAALAGVVVKMYYAYRAEFAKQEEGEPWTR